MKDQPTNQTAALSPEDARYIEAYARALYDLIDGLGKDDHHMKSYDPMTVSEDGAVMHSYVFEMLDGGRHHKVADYRNRDHICEVLLAEAVRHVNYGH